MLARVVAAALVVVLPTLLPAGAPAVAAEEQMPTILVSDQVESQAARHLTISYADAARGLYRVVVDCVTDPAEPPLRWSTLHRRNRESWTATQDFTAEGGLPPGASCTAVVRRDADGATSSASFDVVWGEQVLYLEPVPAKVWPAPEDGGQQLRVVAHVREPGHYSVSVRGRHDLVAELDLGHRGPGRYPVEWDLRDRKGVLVAEGRYAVYLDADLDPPYLGTSMWGPRRFSARYGTESLTVHDRRRERGSRHVDVAAFTLTNAPTSVDVGLRFRSLRPKSLAYLSVGLDVNRLEKGYLLTATRDRRGRLAPRLALAHLASDVGHPTTIRCRGLRVRVGPRTVQATVPRACLRKGGRRVRAYYSVGDRHHHYDSGPDSRRTLWTGWVTYEHPPA